MAIDKDMSYDYLAKAIVLQLRQDIAEAVRGQIEDIMQKAISEALENINISSVSRIDPLKLGSEIRLIVEDKRKISNG